MINGMGMAAIIVSFPFMESINVRERITRMTIRKTDVSCSDTKLRRVSTSDVQRWMVSPV